MDPLNRKQRRAAKGSSSSGSDSEDNGSGSGSGSDSGAATSPKSPTTPSKSASKKGRRAKDDLSEFAQPANVDLGNAGLYVGVAAILSIAPAYLYSTVFDLSLSDFGIGYLIAAAVSTAALAMAYHVVCTYNYAVLSNQRKSNSTSPKLQKELGYSEAELDAISRSVTAKESLYYSLIFNNAVYLILFAFLAGYMLRDVSTAWNYLTSQIITGGVTYYIATTFAK